MVKARLLDEHIAGLQRRSKGRYRLYSTFGQEACRVATAIELTQGDLVSDVQANASMGLLFGVKPVALLRHIVTMPSSKEEPNCTALLNKGITSDRQLPWIEDADDRIKMALGSAVTYKTQKLPSIVVAYLNSVELPKKLWKHIFKLAAELNLPIIFVALPESGKKAAAAANVGAIAKAAGIPSIPVDAKDAVALYRVAQESIGRARGGDGPVLIQCIAIPALGKKSSEMNDALNYLKSFMIERKVCTEHWAGHIADVFRKEIATLNL